MINHHAGWGKTTITAQREYIKSFAKMLHVPGADLNELIRVFSLFSILHFDHGGGNLSTFVGKAVASGLEDMYGSLCSACCVPLLDQGMEDVPIRIALNLCEGFLRMSGNMRRLPKWKPSFAADWQTID